MRAGPSPAPTPCEQVFLSSTGPRHMDRDASRHHLLPARANLALPRRRARGRCRAPALRDQRAAARRRRLRPCARRVRANPRHRALERRALQLGYCHEQLGPSRFQQGRHRPLEQLRAAKRFAARHAPNASDTANRSTWQTNTVTQGLPLRPTTSRASNRSQTLERPAARSTGDTFVSIDAHPSEIASGSIDALAPRPTRDLLARRRVA